MRPGPSFNMPPQQPRAPNQPPNRPPNVPDPREAANKKLFSEVFEGDFENVHHGIKFPIDIPGVEAVTVTTPETKSSAQVNIFFRDQNGKEGHTTMTITRDGDLIGKIPRQLAGADRNDIYGKVLNGLRPFMSGFWIETDMDVIPPGAWPTGAQGGVRTGAPRPAPNIDPARLAFLEHQADALFGHITEKEGFKDYRLVFFPDYIVLEHPLEENAAYFIDLPETIVLPSHPTKAEMAAVVKKYWHPDLQITKGQMRNQGFTRVPHTGDWMTRLQEEINRRPRHKQGPAPRP